MEARSIKFFKLTRMMIRKARITTAILTVGLLTSVGYPAIAQPNRTSPTTESTPTNSTKISSIDRDFVIRAAQGGFAEVGLSRLALERSTDNQIRQFARQMIKDHTDANRSLAQLAKQKAISLPTDMDAEHRAIMAQLEKLPARSFDEAYMRVMELNHQRTIDLFQMQARRGQDRDLKTFASNTLPTLREHLQMIRSMKRDNEQPNTNSPRQTEPDPVFRRDGGTRER